MKFTSATCLGLAAWTVASSFLTGVEAARGTSAAEPDFLESLRRNHVRGLKTKDSGDPSGGGGGGAARVVDGTAPLLPDQCYICTKDIGGVVVETGERPIEIVAKYVGGTGVLSRYQDDSKASCRDQVFPESGPVTFYGQTLNLKTGDIFTITNPGGKLDAETDFTFSNGFTCFIHTSCSQPLVGGDQIGPILLLEANECVYKFCGDGVKDADEECDEGDAMPTATCKNCTVPFCGDGV